MARIFDDSAFRERANYTSRTPTIEESDASEKARARAKAPVPKIGLPELYAELSKSVTESKTFAAEKTAELAETQLAQAEAAAAQAAAKENAIAVAAQTGAKIDEKTGILTPKTTSTSLVDNKDGGGTQFVEYEYSKDFKKRRAKFFNPTTGQFTYGEWEDAPMSKEEFDKQQAAKIAEEKALNEKRDAFALIEATMRSYGFNESELKELIDYIQSGLLNPALGANQLVLQLRQLPSYKARFAGNEERRARGLNTLDESDYIRQENAYAETLRQYGLQRLGTRQQYATLMGNAISNIELGKRVALGVDRLQNADPAVLNQLRKYYNITDTDVLAYLLNPKEMLPELEAKVTTAEIGATAQQFGLNADLERMRELEKYGVNLQSARAGYSQIASRLPRATQLSDIYKQSGITYNQLTGEEEEFKGLASAKRARERLAELETAAFSGAAGLGRTSLGRTTGGQI